MTLTPAFWDSSALLPLCVPQIRSQKAAALYERFAVVAWWASEVEILSGLSRLRRMGDISHEQFAAGKKLATIVAGDWSPLNLTASIVPDASSMLEQYPLRAADALQVAAALVACEHYPGGYAFITADLRQAEAARQVGFAVEFL